MPPVPGGSPAPEDPVMEEVVRRLAATTSLSAGTAARVVEEVLAYLSEPLEQFVRRRHRELQAAGLTNPQIFARLRAEIPQRRFAAEPVSDRQLMRMVYG